MAGEVGFFQGLADSFSNINWGDIGSSALKTLQNPDTLKTLGGLAGAWGNYKTGKAQSDFANKQYNYQVEQDEYAKKKKEAAQAAIDNAWSVGV